MKKSLQNTKYEKIPQYPYKDIEHGTAHRTQSVRVFLIYK